MKISILGATGSIGEQTLDVIARHPDKFQVLALSANRNHERLFQFCKQCQPRYAVLMDATAAQTLTKRLRDAKLPTEVLTGSEALSMVASLEEVDCVVAGIVGAAGLLPTLSAIRAGKRILFANKEPLVMAGDLIMQAVKESGAVLLPVDSEHNAIFQSLPDHYQPGDQPKGVRRIVLTASGGPFRTKPIAELSKVTPEQACQHPNWNMGQKISVDCATLFNKGLEVIEAHYLFKMPLERIDVVIHPQSVIHSLVEYQDGSFISQLGLPDMRIPITNALAWPERIDSGVASMDLTELGSLTFSQIEHARYPCFDLALRSIQEGGTATTIANAANEIAVSAFLQRHIGYCDIPNVIEETLTVLQKVPADSLATIQEADHQARSIAMQFVANQAQRA